MRTMLRFPFLLNAPHSPPTICFSDRRLSWASMLSFGTEVLEISEMSSFLWKAVIFQRAKCLS